MTTLHNDNFISFDSSSQPDNFFNKHINDPKNQIRDIEEFSEQIVNEFFNDLKKEIQEKRINQDK